MNRLVLQWHCNAAQISDFGDNKLFEHHMLKAEEVFNDIGKHLLPWYSQWQNTEGNRLAELYKKFREEEKQPGFQVWRQKVKEGMKADENAATEVQTQRREALQKRQTFLKAQAQRQARRRGRARLR